MNQLHTPVRLRLDRAHIPTTAADVDFFCRRCKGHYSRTAPVRTIGELACHCGSRDLLIYAVSSDGVSPLRAS